jgi:hypothetical protein
MSATCSVIGRVVTMSHRDGSPNRTCRLRLLPAIVREPLASCYDDSIDRKTRRKSPNVEGKRQAA